ncbi:bifunctional 2-polyprenyl-6-hydroxyphenol methylase/3-demethylubiquinol 3-O-methyltransferase UbiG [Pedobacter sp. L105]|uniref:class I SAM-dependent methyltransferase n=1 Tax=Pedobacter sp. L105 TaxID=1641871 RepID=UPI00131BB44F|nr:class I SAM-dependent methyltransferase [Pedobacter sp. L105]
MKTSHASVSQHTLLVAGETFEDMYTVLRNKEGRTYTDEQVALLPYIKPEHPNEKEWKIRTQSSDRLVNHLQKQRKPLNILEVGSGNGWLSAKLAKIENVKVTGLEPNNIETEQAQRVFKKSNLRFITGNFSEQLFKDQPKFDVIIFAASLQYFPIFKEVIENAFALLNPNGYLHILDTNFYKEDELQIAKERCVAYFNALGLPLMSGNYFHHLFNEIYSFKHKIMFSPHTLWNKLTHQQGFYWIILKP